MRLLILTVLIGACCAQTPTRPNIPETFESQVSDAACTDRPAHENYIQCIYVSAGFFSTGFSRVFPVLYVYIYMCMYINTVTLSSQGVHYRSGRLTTLIISACDKIVLHARDSMIVLYSYVYLCS